MRRKCRCQNWNNLVGSRSHSWVVVCRQWRRIELKLVRSKFVVLCGDKRRKSQGWWKPVLGTLMHCCYFITRNFFLFLVYIFYLLIVRTEGYYCTWSHPMIHTLSRIPLDEGSARRRDTIVTRDIHNPGGIRTCNTSERPCGIFTRVWWLNSFSMMCCWMISATV